jgi:hypothetical protein
MDFSEIGDNIRDFFSQRQKALLLSCVLIIFFCAALIAIILIPQKKEVPSASFRSPPLEADQELLLPQGVSIPQEYAVSRQTNEKWTDSQVHEWLTLPDEEAVKKLSASNDSLIKSITEAAP